MRLFSVTGTTIRDGDLSSLYVCKEEREAKERFIRDFDDYSLFSIIVQQIDEVDGYKIELTRK